MIGPPPGEAGVPPFDDGWLVEPQHREPFLSYAPPDASVHWSPELEALHEESSRTHFIDVWTRQAMVDHLGEQPSSATLLDLGCSTGYLLEDLSRVYPTAMLVGVDLVSTGLKKAHGLVPSARLIRADACELPFSDGSFDGAVSANLLEHIPDDRRALRELARVLRPSAKAVLVVPAGPSTFDYYDRFLGHERRYARGELAAKAADAGLSPRTDCFVGSLLYPVFWMVKQRNRRRFDHLDGEALEQRVAADIAATNDSMIGHLACKSERRMLRLGIRLPFGIRNLVVVERC